MRNEQLVGLFFSSRGAEFCIRFCTANVREIVFSEFARADLFAVRILSYV
jgi:hypothetical protein